MPRSLIGRLTAVLALLLAAAGTSGAVMYSLFEQSTAARIGQASAVAGQACGALARAYRLTWADRSPSPPALDAPDLRRDVQRIVETALAGREGVEGGLWQLDAGSLAYAFPTYEGGEPKRDLPGAESSRIHAAVAAASANDRPELARYDATAETLLIASCPLPGPIPRLAGWTMTRVHSFAGGTYVQLMAGLGILSAATLGATLLVAVLVITWRRHVTRIEDAFARAGDGELPRLALTGERELDRIVRAMNDAGRRLAQSRDETRALARQVAEGERLAAVGRVAAGVAHGIRNPIAAMRLKAETALRGSEDRKDRALQLVIAQVDRLDGLVRRLLAVTERASPQPVATALAPFLASVAAAARGAGSPIRIACSVETAGLDQDQMRRALECLLANAAEAAEGGPIELAAGRVGDRLVLSVSDRGRGPPEEIRQTMFEPFVTSHPEHAGLGLAIVREIARAHGGDADAERRDGATIVRIEVPWLAS